MQLKHKIVYTNRYANRCQKISHFIKDYKVKAALIDFNDGRNDGHLKKNVYFIEHKSEF